MLTDPKAVEIIRSARQVNVARADVSDAAFGRIVADFFQPQHFAGRRVLELGPGHYDFARRARGLDAQVTAVDHDPAVLDLGRYFGFTVVEADLMCWDPVGEYDGLFCKGSVNALWHRTPDSVAGWTARLDAVLVPGGWGWVAPWNGGDPATAGPVIDAQTAAFESAGWTVAQFDSDLSARYGTSYQTVNNPLFVKGLTLPDLFRRG